MTTIYVLFGESGEYSDRQEWAIRGYTAEADADADCAAMNVAAMALESRYRDRASDAVRMRLTAHDAFADVHGDTTYSVTAVPLVDAPQVSSEGHEAARQALAQRAQDRKDVVAEEARQKALLAAFAVASGFTGYQFYGKETR